ncbi:hypothetical protein [Leptolyngbya sp. 7M]|uniref:hypothetical protein n=1 Tax=Leptolyngbya sp. 7M TaxID=2812896 RepID=UPI001B8A914D|nr:hypothetical protein [Leptolyngbya sp. 7M]QYO62428.1 hypothetical protein JVX88_20360 [Leptolyngbya sp. 7M]
MTRAYAYSIEKACTQLGYQPKISFDEGMRYTAEWLQQENVLSPEWLARAKAS